MSTNNLCFEQKYENYQNFYLKTFSFLVVKFSIYLNRCVFEIFCFSSDNYNESKSIILINAYYLHGNFVISQCMNP